jgi:hypothetical protein
VSDEIVFLYKYFLCLSDKHFTGGLRRHFLKTRNAHGISGAGPGKILNSTQNQTRQNMKRGVGGIDPEQWVNNFAGVKERKKKTKK